jgi:hypothetical protein
MATTWSRLCRPGPYCANVLRGMDFRLFAAVLGSLTTRSMRQYS